MLKALKLSRNNGIDGRNYDQKSQEIAELPMKSGRHWLI
jgi:hypothetical protein